MNNTSYITFPAIELTQPIGTFYIGAIRASDIVEIAFADIRRIEQRDIEKIVGIQRPLLQKRVNEISDYVNTIDATFPTSVILAIDSLSDTKEQNIIYNKTTCTMSVRRDERVAQIIDGQHRIAGLRNCTKAFDVNVAIFVDMDLEDKGNVFATINLQQTKVNKSLVYDLFEYAKSRSPQKTCHNIAKLFCRETGSPFEGRIKILGSAMGGSYEFLTQATFVDRLIVCISSDAMADRDKLKRGKKIDPAIGKERRRLIFRDFFIREEDAKIAKILWNFFCAVSEKWPSAWNSDEKGNILPRTNGFSALMRYLRDAYNYFETPGAIIKKEEFRSLLDKVELKDEDFTIDNYKPGTSGETLLYQNLVSPIRSEKNLFE